MNNLLINQIATQIVDKARSLGTFTLEMLFTEIKDIPNSIIKTECIDWLINNPDIEVDHGLYSFKNQK